jgi:hypothetical protein
LRAARDGMVAIRATPGPGATPDAAVLAAHAKAP